MNKKYLNMIQKMKVNGPADWHVYMLRCGDGSLYTGITKNLESRFKQHEQGKGAAYTRTHLPISLVYFESKLTRSEALIREAQIKRMSKSAKEQLVISNMLQQS